MTKDLEEKVEETKESKEITKETKEAETQPAPQTGATSSGTIPSILSRSCLLAEDVVYSCKIYIMLSLISDIC